ncbi:UNVERIFIED_CONTAM: hypothetical protein K2H54_051204 [Gekko kuhli]
MHPPLAQRAMAGHSVPAAGNKFTGMVIVGGPSSSKGAKNEEEQSAITERLEWLRLKLFYLKETSLTQVAQNHPVRDPSAINLAASDEKLSLNVSSDNI